MRSTFIFMLSQYYDLVIQTLDYFKYFEFFILNPHYCKVFFGLITTLYLILDIHLL